MDLERRVVNMLRRRRGHEERMMIDVLVAAVNMPKEAHLLLPTRRTLFLHPQEVRGHYVEVAGIELDLSLQVGNAEAVVAELVDGGGTVVEALESSFARLLDLGVVDELLGQLTDFGGGLAEDQVDGEAFGVVELDAVTAAGGVGQFFDRTGVGEFGCSVSSESVSGCVRRAAEGDSVS